MESNPNQAKHSNIKQNSPYSLKFFDASTEQIKLNASKVEIEINENSELMPKKHEKSSGCLIL
jgi:hypothetical protein